jgi:hypothetical protein
MAYDYFITGGYLKVQKKVFVQEMLSKDSRLRALLNWKSTSDFLSIHPEVGKPDNDDIITINFSNRSYVSVGESPKDFLGDLKARYREKVKGRIACRGSYVGVYTFEIDLNSDDGNIEYILE